MPVAYILQSQTSGKFYIGSAEDLQKRFEGHQRGQTQYTRTRGPWLLVYQEEYKTLAEARRRERRLKSWKSHRSIQELIDGKRRNLTCDLPGEPGRSSVDHHSG